ncbi:helix-turn-helix domain-containing protein [Dongia deserti]|uniref:helix-turn-helix domain-containing protein n=1 Tax=Dongia deserti TaxID=2268030 RepID=UPI0013C53A59|nr:helix-turn-helix domain-containing protein [Dongia deserti]
MTAARKRPPAQTQRWSECGRICAIVAEEFGIAVAEMLSERRDLRTATPRMVAMYLAHRATNFSLTRLGWAFERDHTTILHAVNTIKERIGRDPDLRFQVDRCESAVRDPAVLAAERAVARCAPSIDSEIDELARQAFSLDPIGAAGAVRDGLRAFLATKEDAA